MKKLIHLTSEVVANAGSRTEMFEGQEYLVYPVIALVEGVHNNLFYPASEISKFPQAWNGRPIPVQHPVDNNGINISANDPRVLERQNIGFCFNFGVDDKDRLKGELWVNKNKAVAYDANLIAQMNNNMEVSTCLWLEGDDKPGLWNNEQYVESVYNFRPDHIAILPGREGACNWQDGCGVRVNQKDNAMDKGIEILKAKGLSALEMSMEETQQQIYAYINSLDYKEGEDYIFHFLEAVYDGFFIYSRTPTSQDNRFRFYKQEYSVDKNDQVDISENKMEVRRKVSFQDVSTNQLIVQDDKEVKMPKENKTTPCCPDKVAALIANEKTPWTTDDAEYLNGLSKEKIEALEKMVPTEEPAKPVVAPVEPKSNLQVNEDLTDTARKAVEPPKPMTVNEYIANAPPEVRDMLTNVMSTHQKMRGELIQALAANESCSFTKEQLEGMDLNMLQALSKLAGAGKKQEVDLSRPIYPGLGPTTNIGVDDEEPLAINATVMPGKKE